MGDGSDFDIEQFLLQEALAAADEAESAKQLNNSNKSGVPVKNQLPDDLPEYYSLVWPNLSFPIVDAWLKQSLTFSKKTNERICIVQPLNGPCGVLSVLQGVLIANRLLGSKSREKNLNTKLACDPNKAFTDKEISDAVFDIIAKSSATVTDVDNDSARKSIKVVTWKNRETIGAQVHEENFELSGSDLESDDNLIAKSYLFENVDQFKSEGGIVLLVYSCVATAGVESIKKDMHSSGAGAAQTLVEFVNSKTWFCSSELMSLLLRGVADGNLSAYNSEIGSTKKRLFDKRSLPLVGILSYKEAETKIPLADEFKFPEKSGEQINVWVMHGGDHFTTAYLNDVSQIQSKRAKNDLNKETNSDETSASSKGVTVYELLHWNGLPPSGPRMTRIKFRSNKICSKAANVFEQNDYIPLPGEIDDIVQVHGELKKKFPFQFNKWLFEVVLAIDDPTVKGPERPPDMKVYKISLGSKPTGSWRCASCYRNRHQTFIFGDNKVDDVAKEKSSDECKFCGKTKDDAMWTVWLKYEQFPPNWKRRIDFYYGPKMLTVLRTLWPDCETVSPAINKLPNV